MASLELTVENHPSFIYVECLEASAGDLMARADANLKKAAKIREDMQREIDELK